MSQAVVVLDKNLCVTTANNAFVKAFRLDRDEVIGTNFFDLGNGQWNLPELRHLIAGVIPKAAAVVGFEVKHDFPLIGPRTFLVDARRLVHPDDNSSSILVIFGDVTERQRRDAEKDFIISETRHRMVNLFAVVRAIAVQTETRDRTAGEYRDSLLGRLQATLRAQEIAASHQATDFEDLLRRSVGEAGEGRLDCTGAPLQVPSSRVLAIGMIFHELGTNALKYGALSAASGRVHVTWAVEEGLEETSNLVCEWRGIDGPPVSLPSRRGYGTELIEGTSAHLGGHVELHYHRSGLSASIQIPL
jgi:two-component sensor histidine kinase